MAMWENLRDELDAWHQDGRTAVFWWRDDDACTVTPALERALTISDAKQVPVALAVIPRDADNHLCVRIADCQRAAVLLHGWAHANHAPADERQCEYGLNRSLPDVVEELKAGVDRLNHFANFLPVLVAPWNRIDPHFLPYLPEAGVHGLSVLGPRSAQQAAPGVTIANVHVDIVDWTRGGFVGEHRALEQAIDHLRQKRLGEVDDEEPTGLMTHHGFHDPECWSFIEAFLDATSSHPAARWASARGVFCP
jgi:hypothetical protein